MQNTIRLGTVVILALSCHMMNAEDRAFSVKDSIRMVRFNSQSMDRQGSSDVAVVSPDGRYSLVLTSRGVIETNQIESTLWLFDNRAIHVTFARSIEQAIAVPQILAKHASRPVIDIRVAGVYGPVITDVQWSADSKVVYFIGENSRAERQLYSVNLDSRVVRPETPAGQDVESFDITVNTIVYRAFSTSKSANPPLPGDPINAEVSDITGVPIQKIISDTGAHDMRAYDLWCIHDHLRRLVYKAAASVATSGYILSRPLVVSPEGRYAIILVPATEIPKSWESYATPARFSTLKLNHEDKRPISPYNAFPLRHYILVNLSNGTASDLGALDARYFNYPGAGAVSWSERGDKFVLTNVLLPFDHMNTEEAAKRTHPCEAAVFSIKTSSPQCLDFSSTGSTSDGSHLQGASFGFMGNEIVLKYGLYGQAPHTFKDYRFVDNSWRPAENAGGISDQQRIAKVSPVTLQIKEGMNQRPTLWAEDTETRAQEQVWDPNQDFAHLKSSEVSVYHWKDIDGREWTGGLFMPVDYVRGIRYPLVIQTHGFDENKFVTDGAYPTAMAARPLASVGIMVLQVGGASDVSQLAPDNEATRNVQAYEAAISKLDSDGLIDSKKVGIVGFSRTCWYVINALEGKPNRFAAATLADGVSYSYMQYRLFGASDDFVQHDFEKVIGSVPLGDGLQNWLRLSPDFHGDLIEAPLRIEAIEPYSVLQEWEIYSSLQMQGKPVDMIYFPNGQHILQKPLERLASQQGNVDWFRFWLQGYERANPEDQDQYKRWEHMRELRDADNKAGAVPSSGNDIKPQ